jgi:hypothetical protein
VAKKKGPHQARVERPVCGLFLEKLFIDSFYDESHVKYQ